MKHLVCYGAMWIVAAWVAGAAAAEPLRSTEELQQLLREGQYQSLVRQVTRILQLNGEAAQSYDRCDLLMLKAQAHLGLKAATAAGEAFAAAAEAASDSRKAAVARGYVLLLRRANGLTYAPQTASTTRPHPIGIVDPETRKAAMAALLADESVTAGEKVRVAKEGQALPPVLEAIAAVRAMRDVELAATDKDTQAKPLLAGLSDSTRQLMADTLRGLSNQLAAIAKLANQPVDGNGQAVSPRRAISPQARYRRRGLSSENLKALRETIDTSRRIASAAAELATALEAEPRSFDSVVADAERISKRADEILGADYMEVGSGNPGQ